EARQEVGREEARADPGDLLEINDPAAAQPPAHGPGKRALDRHRTPQRHLREGSTRPADQPAAVQGPAVLQANRRAIAVAVDDRQGGPGDRLEDEHGIAAWAPVAVAIEAIAGQVG